MKQAMFTGKGWLGLSRAYLMVRTDADLRQPQALAHVYIQCCTNAPLTALPKLLPFSQSAQAERKVITA